MQHCIHTYTRQLMSRPQLAFAVRAYGHADRSTVLAQCNRAAIAASCFKVVEHGLSALATNRPTDAMDNSSRMLATSESRTK